MDDSVIEITKQANSLVKMRQGGEGANKKSVIETIAEEDKSDDDTP